MRLWLGAAFAGVGLITAVAVYLFVSNSSERVLQTARPSSRSGARSGWPTGSATRTGDASGVIAGANGRRVPGLVLRRARASGRAADAGAAALGAIGVRQRAVEGGARGRPLTRGCRARR